MEGLGDVEGTVSLAGCTPGEGGCLLRKLYELHSLARSATSHPPTGHSQKSHTLPQSPSSVHHLPLILALATAAALLRPRARPHRVHTH